MEVGVGGRVMINYTKHKEMLNEKWMYIVNIIIIIITPYLPSRKTIYRYKFK